VMHWPADVIAGSGAGWAREDFHWFWIEPEQGRFQWDYYDHMVELLLSRGVNIIGVLGHPPGWATAEPGDGQSEPSFYGPDPQAFAEFAYQVVSRYRYRVVHWEIWNEPDNPQFWKPAPDPFAYAQLLTAVSPAISAAAPETNILLGGINPFEPSYLRTLAEVGAWWTFDIINIHPYVDPFPPEANGEIGVSAIRNIQQVTNWAGGKPIWVTEFGWSAKPSDRDPNGVSEEDQANYMVRAAALLRAAGVDRVLWYSIKDERQNGYGVLRFGRNYDDYSEPRPSYTAFKTLNGNLARATFERRLPDLRVESGDNVYALRFGRLQETVDVVWALTPSIVLLPTTGDGVQVVNRNGDSWWVPAENGWVRLYPDASPLYIHMTR
jgi:polysaccharide biosynthesis protein PslG